MSGCNASYGMARHPGMPGKYMDVALHNRSQPGTPASQAVPKGMRLGDGIELLPPERKQARNDGGADGATNPQALADGGPRSEEHTSELQSLMRISYAVFCLKKKKHSKQRSTATRQDKNKTIK